MRESNSENYSNLPLPLDGATPKATPAPKTQSVLPASEKRLPRLSQKISRTPIIPGGLSPQDTYRLDNLETELTRYDNLGSVPTAPIAEEIAQLSAKQTGYSLTERKFSPGSVMMNLDPIEITEDGHPVYPWISGEKGRELREAGVLMKQPDWHKRMAKHNKRIRTKNAL